MGVPAGTPLPIEKKKATLRWAAMMGHDIQARPELLNTSVPSLSEIRKQKVVICVKGRYCS